jgi:hypothetical protein
MDLLLGEGLFDKPLPTISVNLGNILVTTRTAGVPEPSALLLLSVGLIGVVSLRKFTGADQSSTLRGTH